MYQKKEYHIQVGARGTAVYIAPEAFCRGFDPDREIGDEALEVYTMVR